MFNAFLKGKIVHERKIDRVVERIILLYNEEDKRFQIGRHFLPLYASDILLIFGIISRKQKIDFKYDSKKLSPFVSRRFKDVDRLDGMNIKQAILEALDGTT